MDALSAAAALLPDLRVEPAGTLRRSDRSEVLRVRVSGRGWTGPDTLIVKLCPDAGESWARESAACLTVPWPSCWCCFTLPAGVTRQALGRYRSAAAGRLPYLGTPAFEHDVALATAGWALVSSAWFLGRALGEDQPFGSETDEIEGLPARRAVIAHRLATAQRTSSLPALAALAARLHATLIKRLGGEPPLRLAPAFRPG